MQIQLLSKLKQQIIPHAGTIVVVLFILFAYNAWAAPDNVPVAQSGTPGVISYQGTLTDSADQPVNGNIDMTFRLYDAPTGGTALWTEAHTETNAVPVQDGLFHVLLGSLNPVPSTVWTNGQLYLSIQVGSEPEMEPREQLGAVPLAMTVPSGSITTEKVADRAITSDKMAVTHWNISIPDHWQTNTSGQYLSVPGMDFSFTPPVDGVVLLDLATTFKHSVSGTRGFCAIGINGNAYERTEVYLGTQNQPIGCSTNRAYPVQAGETYQFSQMVYASQPGTFTISGGAFSVLSAVFFGSP